MRIRREVDESEDDDFGTAADVTISGSKDRNRAVHGDLVAIQLLGKDDKNQRTGKVVGIIQRNWREYIFFKYIFF